MEQQGQQTEEHALGRSQLTFDPTQAFPMDADKSSAYFLEILAAEVAGIEPFNEAGPEPAPEPEPESEPKPEPAASPAPAAPEPLPPAPAARLKARGATRPLASRRTLPPVEPPSG